MLREGMIDLQVAEWLRPIAVIDNSLATMLTAGRWSG